MYFDYLHSMEDLYMEDLYMEDSTTLSFSPSLSPFS